MEFLPSIPVSLPAQAGKTVYPRAWYPAEPRWSIRNTHSICSRVGHVTRQKENSLAASPGAAAEAAFIRPNIFVPRGGCRLILHVLPRISRLRVTCISVVSARSVMRSHSGFANPLSQWEAASLKYALFVSSFVRARSSRVVLYLHLSRWPIGAYSTCRLK